MEHTFTEAFEAMLVPNQWRFRSMLRFVYSVPDLVISVSYGQAAWLRRMRVVPADKLAVIPPFTDCGHLMGVPMLGADTEGPLLLGAYGRYCLQKGFATLLEAMRAVDPGVATLSLRGFGLDQAALAAVAAMLPHVTMGGRLDDLEGFLGTHDAIVVPSTYEAYGQVALEARMAGRPVIVSAVDGLTEQVEPAFGYAVPSQDAGALAEVIRAMAAAKAQGRLPLMGRAARQSAQGHAAESTARWVALISGLTQGASVPRVEARAAIA
jgi:glycosyltransferase involved in cell wall biosynthesis